MQTPNKVNECPVCRSAGKSETGHWIRNEKGTVVCPTLLEQSCRHCDMKGHTQKYCVVKKQEEKNNRRVLFNLSAAKVKPLPCGTKENKNSFGPLTSDDDEDMVEIARKKHPFRGIR